MAYPHTLSLLSLVGLFACQPSYQKFDETTESSSSSTEEPSSEVSTDPNEGTTGGSAGSGTTDSGSTDPNDPTGNPDDELRCCYFIQMMDMGGDGWNRSLLSVMVDGSVYANVSLSNGGEGFREVCLDRGSDIAFYWNAGLDNNENMLSIFSMDGMVLYDGMAPQSGVLLESVSDCPQEMAVDASYEEFDSETYPIDPTDPTDPDNPGDPGLLQGEYIGLFELLLTDTGVSLCTMDMPFSIDPTGSFYAHEICPIYGFNVNILHLGQLYMMQDDTTVAMEQYGFIDGIVEISDPSGMISISAPFYGECNLDMQTGSMNLFTYFESMWVPPNGAPMNIFGQLSYVQ